MTFKIDGFANTASARLRCILFLYSVLQTGLNPQDLRALNSKLFTLPLNFDLYEPVKISCVTYNLSFMNVKTIFSAR